MHLCYRLLPALLLLILHVRVNAQTSVEVELSLSDPRQQPLRGAEVQLTELGSRASLKGRTGNDGTVKLNITSAGAWEISVNGTPMKREPIRVALNETSIVQQAFTVNPELDARIRRQSFVRLGFRAGDATAPPDPPAEGYNLLTIKVAGSDRRPAAGKTVRLVDLKGQRIYTAQSDAQGNARFHVPGRTPYDIDVEEQLNAGFVQMDDKVNMTIFQSVMYDAYDIVETRRNDTVTQALPANLTQRASRARYQVQVHKGGRPWSSGTVYLDEIGSTTVYTARTDAAGAATFVLPFGKRYMIQFPYQRDVDVINLADVRQRGSGSRTLYYEPDPALEFPERYIPPPGRLVLTDFPYYHRLPYPPPADGGTPGITLRTGRGAGPEALLEIGLATGIPAGRRRAPVNMSFVLDVSGSMAGDERLESLKRGLLQLLQLLRETDVLSIVLFADGPQLLLPAQRLGRDRERISALVQAIEPQGGTDMREALDRGYREALRYHDPSGANTVVLLTDGYDSNPVDTLLAVQARYRGRVACRAIGVGKDYNYDLLKKLATEDGDLLQQAHEGKELETLFGTRLLARELPLARGVRITVRHGDELLLQSAYGIRDVQRGAGQFSGTLGALFPEQQVPLLAAFVPKGAVPANDSYPVTVELAYTDPATGKPARVTQQTELRFAAAGTDAAAAEQKKMYAVAFANSALLRMATAFEKGKTAEAQQAVEAGLGGLQHLYGTPADADIKALVAQLSLYRRALKNVVNKQRLK
ncbi:VWA domain-containing protein [Flaviaesturariibacter amylovorans]|uniref:VWFA domain-containing protein n=1 Tax=Flaviaesturariibacter amylovorans TaxID=1084520 RepID=A0ABP8HNP9_9BACT